NRSGDRPGQCAGGPPRTGRAGVGGIRRRPHRRAVADAHARRTQGRRDLSPRRLHVSDRNPGRAGRGGGPGDRRDVGRRAWHQRQARHRFRRRDEGGSARSAAPQQRSGRGGDPRAHRRTARHRGDRRAQRRGASHLPVRARRPRRAPQLSPPRPPATGADVIERKKTMTVITNATIPADGLEAVKARQRAMWGSGDYAVIGTTLQIVGEQLSEAADVSSGERVLDVAAGNGNATLAAARRFARVTSTDYVPALLERGRARAAAEGLDVTFEVADAEALPYPPGSFDVVLSTFGVMFAPDHAQSASELRRACRLGGRIGLASWTPEGFLGDLLRIVAKYVPPPAGVRSPLLWGTRDHLQDLFADAVSIEHTVRYFAFR